MPFFDFSQISSSPSIIIIHSIIFLLTSESPVIKSFWKNAVDTEGEGTEITEDISGSERTEGIETYAQFELSLNTKDVREYFVATGNLKMARYNSFGIYTGEKVGNEYGNVRLYAVVNFNNRDLNLETSSSFTYRLYSLL